MCQACSAGSVHVQGSLTEDSFTSGVVDAPDRAAAGIEVWASSQQLPGLWRRGRGLAFNIMIQVKLWNRSINNFTKSY